MEEIMGLQIENGVLMKYVGEETEVKVPEGVTVIGEFAFFACTALFSVRVPESVEGIGKGAFSSCDNLTRLELPRRFERFIAEETEEGRLPKDCKVILY